MKMERMNSALPAEHQMMFIIKDYDRKVEEVHELRKEVEELGSALEKQHKEMKQFKNELRDYKKKDGMFKDMSIRLEAANSKKENAVKHVDALLKCMVYVRNQLRHMLRLVDVPGLRALEVRMTECIKGIL